MLQATLTGNIGNEPELKYSANGNAYLRFNVASNGRTRNADGEWVDETTWVRVTLLGSRAESLANHLHKGSRVTVVGKLDARAWLDNDGNARPGLELLAAEIDFASSQNGQQQRGNGQPQGQARQQQRQQPQRGQQGGGQRMSEWQAAHPDDDLPF